MFLQVIYHATHTCCQNLRLSCYESEVRMSHNCLYLSYISKVVVADVISLNSSEKIWRCIIRNHLTFFSVGSIKLMLKHQTQGIWNFSEINLTPFILCYFKIWIPKLIAYNHRSTLFLKIDVGDTMIHIWKKKLLTGSGPSIHNCWLLHIQKRTRKAREESASKFAK